MASQESVDWLGDYLLQLTRSSVMARAAQFARPRDPARHPRKTAFGCSVSPIGMDCKLHSDKKHQQQEASSCACESSLVETLLAPSSLHFEVISHEPKFLNKSLR